MSSFALVSIEKDYKIDVCEGKITVGRGPFLKITDKRVSRNHATLEVCDDGSLTVLPIHTNPTFYRACGESKFEPLEKDEVKKLENGDCISFLPNDLTFRVEKKVTLVVGDTTTEEPLEHKETLEHKEPLEHREPLEHEAADVSGSKDCNFESSSDILEDIDGKDKKASNVEVTSVEMNKEREGLDCSGEVLDDEEEDDVDDDEEDDRPEIEETARPLNKTRVLPSWMTKNEGNEAKDSFKKGKTTKKNVKKDATEVKINKDLVELPGKTKESLEENEDTTNDGNEIKSDKEQSDVEDASVETEERVEEEEKKRKRDESENEGQSSKREKKLPRCPYGSHCYRKNPAHFQEYSHEEESDESENEDDLPECPYGEYCYRKNPRHRTEYKHTPQPKTRERKAKKKAGTGKIRDDDEDSPNDYDFEDSFIDDEIESNHEASDESDWRPSGDDDDDDDGGGGDDDDVRELLSEARNFTKNKKMLKPT